jgi:hypothetical protein
MKIFKINVFLKKRLGSISCTFERKMAFSAIYKTNSAGNHLFFTVSYISSSMGAYLTLLTPSTTAPCPGTAPANSRLTKQFLSRPHGL